MKRLFILFFVMVLCAQTGIAITKLKHTNMNDIMPGGVLDNTKYPAMYNHQVETYNNMVKKSSKGTSDESAQKFAELWNWMVEDHRSKVNGDGGTQSPINFSPIKEGNISNNRSRRRSKAAMKVFGSFAKAATQTGVKMGTGALKTAVTKNKNIDLGAEQKLNDLIDKTGQHLIDTTHTITSHTVKYAGHNIDHKQGVITNDELAAREEEMKADLVRDTGSIAGNTLEALTNHAGQIADHYIQVAGTKADPKKVKAAEEKVKKSKEALKKSKETLKTAQKLESKHYIDLAEKQVAEAKKAVTEAQAELKQAEKPNKYIQALLKGAGEMTQKTLSSAGEFGNAALTIVADDQSEQFLDAADKQWDKVEEISNKNDSPTNSQQGHKIVTDFKF